MSATSGSEQTNRRSSGDDVETLTIREAAELLGVHSNTIRRRVKSGQIRAEKLRTDRGEEYRIFLDDLKRGPRAIGEVPVGATEIAPRSPAMRAFREEDAEIPQAGTLYEDLKCALTEAATLRTERDIVQRQYSEAKTELDELRGRVDDAESRAMKLESERIELLSELEQVRSAYRRSRDGGKKRWRG